MQQERGGKRFQSAKPKSFIYIYDLVIPHNNVDEAAVFSLISKVRKWKLGEVMWLL